MRHHFWVACVGLAASPQALAQASADSSYNRQNLPLLQEPIVNGKQLQPKPNSSLPPLPDPHANDLLKQYPDQGTVTPHDFYGKSLAAPAPASPGDSKRH